MFKRIVSCALLISLIAVSFCSCAKQKEQQKTKYSENFINYFDTVSTIVGFEFEEDAFKKNCEFIEAELKEYNELYDIYKSYEGVNNIRTINKNAGVEPVKVDQKIIDLLDYCIELYTTTQGKTNIAMGSVLSIWHNYRNMYGGETENPEAKLPSIDTLQEAAKHTDINNIIIDRENSTVFLSDEKMTLDVGAVAKRLCYRANCKGFRGKGR